MILVDTNVIINFWRNPTKEVIEIFEKNEIATSGIVLAELLHGARSENELHKITHALSDFSFYEISHDDWFEIGMMLNKLRKAGLKIPFQDVMLAFLAISNNLLFWTNDKHFSHIKKHFNSLQLYSL